MKTLTGYTIQQFEDIYSAIPSLLQRYSSESSARNALYVYLMKLRTGCTNDELSKRFKLTLVTIKRCLDSVRECLLTDFVPVYLRNRTREESILNNTEMSKRLLAGENPNAIIRICDGTYIYIDKSANIGFQKKTYSGQKKRNFLRIMMCVSPDGYIENVFGPYEANLNDAKILQDIVKNHLAELNMERGDIFVLDRGFRDVVGDLENLGFQVRIPGFINGDIGVLTTEQANLSRFCTKIRYVVETKNGHMKQFGIMDNVWSSYGILHLEADFRICAALLNKFSKPIVSDKNMTESVANRMMQQFNSINVLSDIIHTSNTFQKNVSKFEPCSDLSILALPQLTYEQLVLFACGTYQLRLSPNYYNEELKANGEFTIFVCPDAVCQKFFRTFYSNENCPLLLLAEFRSRFHSGTKHHAYIMFNAGSMDDLDAILGHCCSCKNGRRTVGSCVHVVCFLWYLTLARYGNIKIPAKFLDNFFNDNNADQDDV